MRKKFIESLISYRECNPNVFLLVGDLGYNVVEPFENAYPSSFLNVGVAEQNMVSVAAGLALDGKKVFTYTIGNFGTFRPAEFLRNLTDYHKLDITTVCVGGGFHYGNLGPSHQSIQDFGLISLLPNHTIMAPADEFELDGCLAQIFTGHTPNYLRLGREHSPKIHNAPRLIENGVICVSDQGKSQLILSTGDISAKVKDWLCKIEPSRRPDFITIPIWNWKSKNVLLPYLKHRSNVVVVEEHLEQGGLGSLISWLCLENELNVKFTSMSVPADIFDFVGERDFLLEKSGLTEEQFTRVVNENEGSNTRRG